MKETCGNNLNVVKSTLLTCQVSETHPGEPLCAHSVCRYAPFVGSGSTHIRFLWVNLS